MSSARLRKREEEVVVGKKGEADGKAWTDGRGSSIAAASDTRGYKGVSEEQESG